jgi:hypothetical protein
MRGERALAILQNAISPGSDQASINKSSKRLSVIETQLSSSLSPSQIYPTTFMGTWRQCLFNGADPGGMTRTLSTSHTFGVYWYIPAATAADGDEYTISFPMAAGYYGLLMYIVKTNASGKLDLYVDDGIALAGTDFYSAATLIDVEYGTPFSIISDGNHTLKFKVNGKNGASSDYVISVGTILIYKIS